MAVGVFGCKKHALYAFSGPLFKQADRAVSFIAEICDFRLPEPAQNAYFFSLPEV